MKKSYDEKLQNINDWVEIVNYHWMRLEGVLNNDEEFWNDTLHSMTSNDWWDWLDIAPSLEIQYEHIWSKYNRNNQFKNDMTVIKNRVYNSKPAVKKFNKNYNFSAFRLLMNIKDFLNEVNGNPTVDFSKIEKSEEQTQFEKLFEF